MEKGCENCRHKTKAEQEMPCVRCIRNATDKWEEEQDVIAVVRCVKCQYYIKECFYCEQMGFNCKPDDFCSFGKEKR